MKRSPARAATLRFVLLDVTDEPRCRAVAADAIGRDVGILVNNAGIGHVGTMLTTSADDLDRLCAVNVNGVFNHVQGVSAGDGRAQGGSIVNLASASAASSGCATASRTARRSSRSSGMTKCVALDHADSRRALQLHLPRAGRDAVRAGAADGVSRPEEGVRGDGATQLLKRMGRPEEIAAAALYLASDEAAFVTGSCLMIDGGWTAGK